MLMGNCMTGNSLALNTLLTHLGDRPESVEVTNPLLSTIGLLLNHH
jgi:hypothetical protein